MSEEDKNKLLWIIASVLTGSVALNQGINKTFPSVRSDSFTGTQGDELSRQLRSIEGKIDVMEIRVDIISTIQHTMEFRMDDREDMCKETRQMISDHNKMHP